MENPPSSAAPTESKLLGANFLIQSLILVSTTRVFTVCLTLALLFIAVNNHAQKPVPMFSEGEELQYSVSFLGINLGTIKIITEGGQTVNGKSVYKAKAIIDSRQGIPFVDLHSIYESWIDPSAMYSHQFVSTTKLDEGKWEYTKYIFDTDNKVVKTESFVNKKSDRIQDFQSSKRWSDGLSLFFIARQLLNTKKTVNIPTFVMGDSAYTKISFVGTESTTEIDAVDYPVRTKFFKGTAGFTGIYGVTGGFEGWFSDDEARVPIRAKMKLYVGSADIELVKWKRTGWVPPKE